MKKQRLNVLLNFFENTIAYALPVFFQQFIVFPLMANQMGSEKYGHFLTVIALNYFVVSITASVLVNVRLLKNQEYQEKSYCGDFNVFIIAFAIIDIVAMIIGTIIYANGQIDITDILLSIFVVLLFLYHDYILVQYRIEFKFKNILLNNIIICVGYLLGVAVFRYFIPLWQMVFIVPYFLTTIYDFCNTNYIKEPLKITPLFNKTLKQYFILLISTVLGSLVSYGDRLILYPIMDGTAVSVFTSAKLIGKLLALISTPISTFALAYLVKKDQIYFNIKKWHLLVGVLSLGAIYVICIFISNPMITFLYPEWALESLQYVPYTVAGGIIGLANTVLNVFVLRYFHSKWQVIKGAIYLVLYFGFGFTLLKFYGLTGLCIGALIASLVDFVIMLILLGKKYIRFDF